MKKIKYLAMCVIALALASCGSKDESSDAVALEIEENEMGSFSKYGDFSGDVKLKLDTDEEKTEKGAKYIVSIPLKITTDVAWKYNLTFKLSVSDEDHSTINSLGILTIDGEYDFETESDYNNYLLTGDIRKDFKCTLTDEEWKAIKEKGKYLVIKSDTDSDEICARGESKASSSSFSSDEYD